VFGGTFGALGKAMSIDRRFLAILLSIFMLGAGSVTSAMGAPEEPLAISEDRDLRGALEDAFTILSNPSIDDSIKTIYIDDLFQEVDSRCQTSCETVLRNLVDLNKLAESKSAQTLLSGLKDFDRESVVGMLDFNPLAIQKIQQYVEAQDPKVLRFRISASIELIRYVVSIREKALFAAMSSPNSKEQVRSLVQKDIRRLTQQLKSLSEVGGILIKKTNFLQVVARDLNPMTGSIGEDAKETKREYLKKFQLTADEARLIAQAVGDLDMLVWKKLIQSISNNSAFFGEGAQKFFKAFQDDLPKMPADVVIDILTKDFGKPPSEIFVDFDPEKPIKSATIGQTYKAKIRTVLGLKEVIVKVQRPGLQESLDRNREVNAILMKLGKVFFGTNEKAQILDFLVTQVTGFEDAVQNEIDLSRELENLEKARKLLAFQFGVRIPKPIRRYSSSRVLTMEVLPGENIDTLLLTAQDLSQEASAKLFGKFLDVYLFQVFGLGHLHGDMHPGNVLATRGGDIGLIDWAQTFRTRGLVSAPAKVAHYFYRGNAKKLAENFIRMNDSPDFQSESFTAKVQEILDQNKIGKNSLLGALHTAESLPFEEAGTVIGEIYTKATELGFKARPAYFQMIRTSTPAANVLLLIGKGLPTEVRNKILISKLLWLLPGSVAKAIGGYTLEYLSRPQREIARRISNWNREWSRSRAVKAAAKIQVRNTPAGAGPVRTCRKAHSF